MSPRRRVVLFYAIISAKSVESPPTLCCDIKGIEVIIDGILLVLLTTPDYKSRPLLPACFGLGIPRLSYIQETTIVSLSM